LCRRTVYAEIQGTAVVDVRQVKSAGVGRRNSGPGEGSCPLEIIEIRDIERPSLPSTDKLSPTYMNLDRILGGETLSPEMLRSSREALWEIKTIIRGLRSGSEGI
jgi:hypothetical protein